MKRYKLIAVLLLVALVATIFAACAVTEQPQLTVKVNGNEVKANGTVYAVELDSDVTKAVIEATTTVGEIKGSGTFDIKEGVNEFVLTLKANDTETEYTVKVTRKAVLTLAEVKIGETAITADDNGVYNHTVANTVSTVNLTAVATKEYATVDGVGEKTLKIGENTFTLTVKLNDTTKQDYTVKITREAADLTLKEVKIGDEVLTAQDRTYTYNVANEVTRVTISAIANNSAATVDGVGVKENLLAGENKFEVTVSVGKEQAKYTIIVNRAKSSVKTIAKITVDGKDATYDQDTKTYTATVGKFTAKVDIALTSSVSSYKTDESIDTLAEGENEFVITVTAEDGTTETYYLVLNVVLPEFDVSYVGNIDEAVKNEGFTYKYGEKQTINILLAAPYTQSYPNLVVTYKVGDGEAKPVTLDESYGFEVVGAEAIGDITVDVKGIEINTYTITYHRGGKTTTEEVKHGEDAQNAAITPNTETKEVLDGYTYMHDEKWVTQDGGMIVANLTNITADADVYYKDEVLVRSEVEYYNPDNGYKAVVTLNNYLSANSDESITFKVLVKSVASGENAKTSFIIYESTGYTKDGEMSVSVEVDEIGKWFTVVANADKVSVYKPDGTLGAEKKFPEYQADNLAFVIHADAAIAAINPELIELCTVTYLDEKGEQITTEKVKKGSAATYEYSKPSENLGEGYTKAYFNYKWIKDREVADLSNVQENISVTTSYDTYVYKNVVAVADTPLKTINRFIAVGSDGKISFRVRVNNTGWAGLNIIAAGGYVGVSGGVSQGPTWYIVTIDTANGAISIVTDDGVVKQLDAKEYKAQPTTLDDIKIKLSNDNPDDDENLDVAAVNVDIVEYKYYDSAEKTNLIYKELAAKDNVPSYLYVSNADDEGYVQIVDSWTAIGTNHEYYPSSSSYMKHYDKGTLGDWDEAGKVLKANKYIAVENNIAKFRIRVLGEGGTITIYPMGGYNVEAEGQTVREAGIVDQWIGVEVDGAAKTVKFILPDGTIKTHENVSTLDIENMRFWMNGVSFDIATM